MTKKERIILFLLATLNFTHILDFMIMMPLGNYLMPFFDITPRQFSFLVASYTIAASVSGFTAAFFIDSFDRKKALIFAFTGFLIATKKGAKKAGEAIKKGAQEVGGAVESAVD